MAVLKSARIPAYRRHKPTGQAVVTLCGKDHYLGRWDTVPSRAAYDQLIGEWIANGRRLKDAIDLTVNELAAAYMQHADGYYRKNGKPTGSMPGIKVAMGFLRGSYGESSVADFGPLALAALQSRMIAAGQSRVYINDNIDRIRRCFKWGVSQELVPVEVSQALATVPSLKKGRSAARETDPVRPVDNSMVVATLNKLSPIVADMVQLQQLTACRPDEICELRPCDVDRAVDPWAYRPMSHKTEHHGHERIVRIGPKAQAILATYLLRSATAFCFSPAESEHARKAALRAKRKTRVQPSQVCRKKAEPQRIAGDRYTTDSYRAAIQRACALAFPPPEGLTDVEQKAWRKSHRWHPNQLRHTKGTEIRAKFGLEATQTVLGHSSAKVSEIYAERDQRLAAEVMRQVG